jgi:hypothetical protein
MVGPGEILMCGGAVTWQGVWSTWTPGFGANMRVGAAVCRLGFPLGALPVVLVTWPFSYGFVFFFFFGYINASKFSSFLCIYYDENFHPWKCGRTS